MRRSNKFGAGGAIAISCATIPLIVMSWVSYESALTAFA